VSYILDEKDTEENSSERRVEQPAKAQPKQEKTVNGETESINGQAEQISELEEAVKTEKSRADDFFRRLQYLQADFENYRKRVEKEMGDARKYGNERLLADLLTVKDELDLALIKARESKQNPVLLDGVSMVAKRVQSLLAKEGVERVPGVGSKFNPEYQEAALKVPSDDEEGTVVEEVRAGYTLRGRVLRPSIVKVAEKRPVEEPKAEEESKE
jgi:molecular chaperone GrpE